MARLRWDQRFFSTTRGRIVALLRRASRTVDELAQALDLTRNAVRSHLATLERDGLVRVSGRRAGPSKPAHVYALTSDAERLFPKGYGPILPLLLDVLAERLGREALDAVLREAGHRVAARYGPARGRLQERLGQALRLLEDLGGLTEVEQRDGTMRIVSYSCPLATVVRSYPEVCRLVETFLADVIGAPVREHCERGEPLRCVFEVRL